MTMKKYLNAKLVMLMMSLVLVWFLYELFCLDKVKDQFYTMMTCVSVIFIILIFVINILVYMKKYTRKLHRITITLYYFSTCSLLSVHSILNQENRKLYFLFFLFIFLGYLLKFKTEKNILKLFDKT